MKWTKFGIVFLAASALGLGLYINQGFGQTAPVATPALRSPEPPAVMPFPGAPQPGVPGASGMQAGTGGFPGMGGFGESGIRAIMPPPKQLDLDIQKLASELRGGKHDAAKEAQLKKLVEKSFDEIHEGQLREAEALAERLAKLQERLKLRSAKKKEIVDRRVKQLVGEKDDLEWDAPAPRTGGAMGMGGFGGGGGLGGAGHGWNGQRRLRRATTRDGHARGWRLWRYGATWRGYGRRRRHGWRRQRWRRRLRRRNGT